MRNPLSTAFPLALTAFLLLRAYAKPLKYTGVNEAGAEFGGYPGEYGTDFLYPTLDSIDHFLSSGVNIIRFPFLWERMQPTPGQGLDPAELGRLNEVVTYTTSKGAYAILDVHNYNRKHGVLIGSGNVTLDDFKYLWQLLAGQYASNPKVMFGLMNEPFNQTTETVLAIIQMGVDGVRLSGANNTVLVPGNAWTGAHSWTQNYYGTPNADVMIKINDTANNYIFEMHQYLDSDYSGTSEICQSSPAGSLAILAATKWLQSVNKTAFLGEFGVGKNPMCLEAMDDMLTYMEANSDAWVGFAYWAAGPLWNNYMYGIEPNVNGVVDQPQFLALAKHLQPVPGASTSASTSAPTSAPTSASPAKRRNLAKYLKPAYAGRH